MASRIQWIQFNELVVAENHPTWADNDNRPLKQMVAYSNLNPQAEDFPGFIGCYQGGGDPNGVQVGNVRNAFWDVINGDLWMKQVGDNTDEGWVMIGGNSGDHIIGTGDPNAVAVAHHTGKYYDQTDSAGDHPTWVKRDITILRPLAIDWFNGPNDTDITGRTPDGGGSGATYQVGSWLENTGASTGNMNLTGSNLVPTFAGVNCYNLNNVTGLGINQFAAIVIEKILSTATISVGVGVKMVTGALTGYIATVDLDDTYIQIFKYVAGVPTLLDDAVNTDRGFSENDQWRSRFELRAFDDGLTVTLEAWFNGTKRLTVIDATYLGVVGTPAVFANAAGGADPTGPYWILEFYTGSADRPDTDEGWYSQNGFEYRRGIQIGTGAKADHGDWALTSPSTVNSVAIGDNAVAFSGEGFGGSFGNVAVGDHSIATGDGVVCVGANAIAMYDLCTTVGADATTRAYRCTAFGHSANGYREGATALGPGAIAGGMHSLAVGEDSEVGTGSDFSIAIGQEAFVEQSGIVSAIALGRQASVSEDGGIAIGDNAFVNAGHTNSIVLGQGGSSFAANQMLVGGATGFINAIVYGRGDTHATPPALTMRKTNAAGSNITANDWTLIGGLSTGSAAPGKFIFQTGATLGGGSTLQTAGTRFTIQELGVDVTGRISITGGFIAGAVTITYSASMTPDARAGLTQTITANNGTAFTINAPTNPATGQLLTITIRNTSGGALGVATWNAVFKMAAWTQPANANNRSITFHYDGTNWVEESRTTTDVPN